MKRLLCKAGSFPPFLVILLFMISSCTEKDQGYEKVIPVIGFQKGLASITVADTSKIYALAELEIDQLNNAFAYDVFFRFDNMTIVNQLFKLSHPTFTDPATGLVYYKAVVSRGIFKSAITFIPINIATGNKTFVIQLAPDLSGKQNYTLKEGQSSITVNFLDK